MKKEDCKFQNEWDYLEWSNRSFFPDYNSAQIDWNQTLVTKVNQLSAQIFKSSMSSGGSTIILRPKLLPLIESLEFYNPKDKKLSGRYDVEIDYKIDDDVIFVLHRFIKYGLHFVPEYLSPLYSGEYWTNTYIESFSVKDDIVEEYKKGLCGYITIKNYE